MPPVVVRSGIVNACGNEGFSTQDICNVIGSLTDLEFRQCLSAGPPLSRGNATGICSGFNKLGDDIRATTTAGFWMTINMMLYAYYLHVFNKQQDPAEEPFGQPPPGYLLMDHATNDMSESRRSDPPASSA